jgi:hypothetical protein
MQPMFVRPHIGNPTFDRIMSPYWTLDEGKFITAKIVDRQDYERQLRKEFETNKENTVKV